VIVYRTVIEKAVRALSAQFGHARLGKTTMAKSVPDRSHPFLAALERHAADPHETCRAPVGDAVDGDNVCLVSLYGSSARWLVAPAGKTRRCTGAGRVSTDAR